MEKEEQRVIFPKMVDAARALTCRGDCKPMENRLRRRVTNKHPYLAGWRLTEITRDNNEIYKVRENISVELSHLKNMPHGPLTETLTPMYVAGFMDGDGCFSIYSATGWKLSIPQKFPNILYALNVKTALRALKGNWTVKRAADCEFSENDNADDVIILE